MFGAGGGNSRVLGRAAVLLSVFALGMGAGYALKTGGPVEPLDDRQIRPGRVGFTNPLLDCEVGAFPAGRELAPFRPDLERLVESVIARGEATEVGIYFRDLDNGPWIGVNARTPFTPGSLLKVPLMMAALLQATREPAFLDRKIVFPGLPEGLDPDAFVVPDPLVLGRPYTVRQLIERVAVLSDNQAAWMLDTAVDPHVLDQLYRDLGLDPAPARDPRQPVTVTPRSYGSLFRVLYNASYLNREMSDTLLALMSRATYREGLVAGVPRGTVVAHKFGVNAVQLDGATMSQLHDCGIVYGDRRPYFLCVMTRGADERQLGGVIAQTSRLVWEKANR